MSIYSNTETSLAMSTLAIWCRVVQSRDVRSRVFSRPKECSFEIHPPDLGHTCWISQTQRKKTIAELKETLHFNACLRVRYRQSCRPK